MISKTFCAFPFERRIVGPSGNIRPCCNYEGSFGRPGDINDLQIEQLQKALISGQRHKGCRQCWELEDRGLDSERTDCQTSYSEKIKKLELNLSNTCHLKCRMCGSDSSVAWVPEEKSLRLNPEICQFRSKQIEQQERAFESDEQLIEFLEQQNFNHIERLALLGGEPFVQKQMPLVLDYLITKKAYDLTIQITTSLTRVSKAVIVKLSQFKNVDIRLSIEATGPMYEYIRGGQYTLEMVEKNISDLREHSNIGFSMSSALGAYSLFHLGHLFNWCQSHFPDWSVDRISGFWYPIMDPTYLSMTVVPTSIRIDALRFNLDQISSSIEDKQKIEHLFRRIMLISEDHQIEETENFRIFTNTLDKMRQESLTQVEPSFNGLL